MSGAVDSGGAEALNGRVLPSAEKVALSDKAKKLSAMLLFSLASAYDQMEKMRPNPAPFSHWYDRLEINLKLHGDPYPDTSGDDNLDVMLRSKRYADAVAAKLDIVNPNGPEQWLAAVREALSSAPLNVFATHAGSNPVLVVEVPGFAESVAEETAVLVAPKDTGWFRDLEANLRKIFAAAQPPSSSDFIAHCIDQWRQGNHVSLTF